MKYRSVITFGLLFTTIFCQAQRGAQESQNPDSIAARQARRAQQTKLAYEAYINKKFTHDDTLRGTIGPERAWWDVQRYDITVHPDFVSKSSVGKNLITYKVVSNDQPLAMQIDLQAPLHIDSVFYNGHQKMGFTQEGNAWHVKAVKQPLGATNTVEIFFSGTPHESTRPPWSGGWTFAKDSLGRPWMTVTCQGLGASLTMIAPDTLVAVSNGRLQFKKENGDGTTTTKWAVVNPISNYCIIPYIGKYVHFGENYAGEKGNLTLDYWVLASRELPRKNGIRMERMEQKKRDLNHC